MKVKSKRTKRFADLAPGDVFTSTGKLNGYHMKVTVAGIDCGAVNVQGGGLISPVEPERRVQHYPDAVLIPNPDPEPEPEPDLTDPGQRGG